MVEKNMLIGALATSLTQAALEGYYNYMTAIGKSPGGQIPYVGVLEGYVPSLDTWLSCAGVPLALYAVGKLMKKDGVVTMAKGGAIYGASSLIGITMVRISYKAQGTMTYQLVR